MDYFWEIPEWEKADFHLKKLKSMPFQRSIPFFPTKNGLYVIRGPRQIGKSSWLKTILSQFEKSDLHKGKCFYLSCENIQDYKELAEILKSVRNRNVILLDEISFVKEWDRAIKHEVDSGNIQILMITGSHSHDLKAGADRMPGRFENGGEFLLLPMLLDEFIEMRKQAGWSTSQRLTEIQAFFKSGGFPTAVAEAGKDSTYPKKSIDTYWKWLVGDILKMGKQESLLIEIMIQLSLCMQTPLSFQTLAKKTTIGSHNTVQEYISILDSCFALKTLHAIDFDTGAYRFKKDRKFYFTDPLLYWIGLELSGKKIPSNANAEEPLAEMVAHEHLSRTHSRFGYFNNKSGEIDFILPEEWAIEVKWANAATNLSRSYLNLTLPDKKVWTKANYLE